MRAGIAAAVAIIAMPLFAAQDAYVLVDGGMSIVDGSRIEVEKLKRAYGGQFFWFTKGRRAFIVRDAEALRQIRELYEPQMELGRQQADLGAKQAALGRKQAALGAEQAQLGAEQARLAASQIRDEEDRSLAKQQRELSDRQNELAQKQNELARQQSDLGAKQSTLGERQNSLSRELGGKMQSRVDDLIRRGIARKVDR
jgi:bla regulator protein BlaR1